mgnify:CR=1 FL=1
MRRLRRAVSASPRAFRHCVCRTTSISEHETYLPAQQAQARPHPRFPRPPQNPWWPQRPQSTPSQGARAPHPGLSRRHPFEREHRLRSAADFDGVFKTGTRASDPFFTVIALPNTLGSARVGIAVSKRNARRAVDRNRLKRVVRESFRLSPARGLSVDLVILAKVAATTAPNEKLYKALDRRWLSLIAFCERSAANP